MKALEWKNQKGEWVVHYRRPDNHPDVKEWEEWVEAQPDKDCFGAYRVVEASE